jgi:TrmH family RNA methyltransferase
VELSQRRTLLIQRLRRRKTRLREGLVLVEGVRAVEEAAAAGAHVRFCVFSDGLPPASAGRRVVERLSAAGVEAVAVGESAFQGVSDTERSQGLLAVCSEPMWDLEIVRPGGRYLVLDALQDPGNVGTLVRAAAAFALTGVLALDGTVDPWGAKAVRASAGMAFRVPLVAPDAATAVACLGRSEVPILVADAAGTDVASVAGGGPWALVVGNEGGGPRPELVEAARETVGVPMPGGAESLNAGVAGAILLYALTREIRRV